MNKRKILSLAMALSIVAIMAVGATLAYFTDTDAAKNVFTVGNVSIIQHEKDSDGEAFVDNQKLYPATGYTKEATELGIDLFKEDQNWIDKVVTVENDGSEEAYVRTLFAFKMLKDGEKYLDPVDAFDTHALYMVYCAGRDAAGFVYPTNANDGVAMGQYYGSGKDYCAVEIGGDLYVIAEYYYNYESKIAAGQTTHPSLLQVGLESTVTNEQAAYFKDFEILVVSQAVQTEGFTDAETALDTAFGDLSTVDATTLQSWFSAAV